MNTAYTQRDTAACMAAAFVLWEHNVHSLPVDLFAIIKSNKWGIITYRQMADENHCSVQEVATKLKSKDGSAALIDGQYTIAYNDDMKPERIRFTLGHEIGHILLGHLDNGHTESVDRFNKDEYRLFEKHADIFSRNLIAPPAVLAMRGKSSTIETHWLYNISMGCASMRERCLPGDMNCLAACGWDVIQKKQFYDYVKKRRCGHCGNTLLFAGDVRYCPVCGATGDQYGQDGIAYRPYIPADQSGKALRCPCCGNSALHRNEAHCPDCGVYVVNRCMNDWGERACGAIVPGYARFCPVCGGTTTFFAQGILSSWEREVVMKK